MDVAFTFADMAYLAYGGQLPGHPDSVDQLRGIAVLQPNPVLLLIRPGSDIHNFSELRGHRVGIGLPGSSADLTAGFVLNALNLDVERVRIGPLDGALTALTDRRIDAAFIMASYSPLVPAAIRAGVRVLSMSGPTIDRLRLGHQFYRRVVVPPGIFGSSEIHTIGIDRLLVCRASLDENLVYELTKAFLDVLPKLAAAEVTLRDVNVEDAPATPIPLHQGAARYYREKEWAR
jgi:TRAP transporter TAXI family solute receptor